LLNLQDLQQIFGNLIPADWPIMFGTSKIFLGLAEQECGQDF
jgi:hypothetical protein